MSSIKCSTETWRKRVFLIVSVIFVVLYACGILFMQRTEAKTELQSAVDMKSLPEQQVF